MEGGRETVDPGRKKNGSLVNAKAADKLEQGDRGMTNKRIVGQRRPANQMTIE